MPPTLTATKAAGKHHSGKTAFKTALFASVLAFSWLFSPHATQMIRPAVASVETATNDQDLQKTVSLLANRQDPQVRKLLVWLYATESRLPLHAPDLMAFVRNNPGWPRLHAMRDKIEKNMAGTVDTDDTIRWFTDYPPRTYDGIKSYLKALSAHGRDHDARVALQSFWRTATLDKKETTSIIGIYNRYLTPLDHAARVDHLIWEGRFSEADTTLAFSGPETRATGNARLALARMTPNASTLLEALPSHLTKNEGVLFERLRWRRRKNMDSAALEMIAQMPAAPVRADAWWKEMNILARRFIENGQYKAAYDLIKKHPAKDGADFAQAEWLMGWLSLRFMKQPTQSFAHFEKLFDRVNAAISKSRAAYWTARAAEALPDRVLAEQWDRKAANYPSTFYGQLSYAKIFGAAPVAALRDMPVDAAQAQAFAQDERVKIIRLLHKTEMYRFMDSFFARLLADAKTPADYQQVAQLARETGRLYYAIQANKDIQQKLGGFLPLEGYPLLPSVPLQKPEKALIHAIIHRESMFNTLAESPVGARGLMQLMPATARQVSKQIGQGYNIDKLKLDPRYNIMLGSTYLHDMVQRYDGFYPMAIAAYNAGPGRVDRWIVEIGDPRKGQIDVLDWVEMIPIYETRNYVQRVMESYYMYRLRLQEPPRTIKEFVKK